MGSFSIWHWAIVAVVVLLVFAGRLRWAHGSGSGSEALSVVPVPRGSGDSQSRAEALRDELLARIQQICEARQVSTTHFVSLPGAHEVWLRFEFVQPSQDGQLSLRSTLAITVTRHDFHRFENLLTVRIGRGQLHRTVDGLIALSAAELQALLDFAVGWRGPLPNLRAQAVRAHSWQLWRPRNKILRIRTDWQATGLKWLGWTAALLAAVGLFSLVDKSPACQDPDGCAPGSMALPAMAGLVAVACFLADTLMARARRVHVLNIGRPSTDPLYLNRLDSWQTTVNHLGPQLDGVRAAVLARLNDKLPAGIAITREKIGYASVDGKVEREQVIARFRRALAYVHLEAYGDDLYVAWDSHTNAGVWVEQEAARGVDRRSGQHVVANRVVPGWQRPTEYDLNDASFLTEWIHATVTHVVRLKLAEFKIDQDIDFTIQRESRTTALQAENAGGKAKSERRFGLGALKRSA